MNRMDSPEHLDGSGRVEARYLAFLETVSTLRPSLHRYCARMTGSVMDGEDVVQEALIEAYRKLEKYDESRPLKPWLFRIAHNRCIDFLRRRGVRDEADTAAARPETIEAVEPGFSRVLVHPKTLDHCPP
ncbi:MAG: RNA polymerase sigma factor [Candidatus Sulfotelmatobacter sp.]